MKPRYRQAVGLSYNEQESADSVPTVTAKGLNVSADTIVALARRYGVPVVEDKDLSRVLGQLEVDQRIPPALFRSVAALLRYVKQKFG